MKDQRSDLPEFERPPLVETALSVQFAPLSGLDIPRIGLLWQQFRDRLPKVEQQPPLGPMVERIGVRTSLGSPSFQVLQKPPIPRCWFLSKAEDELVQIQQDRFGWNWRKTPDGQSYPRYERTVRPRFIKYFQKFLKFLQDQGVGEFIPNQCEVTYANEISLDDIEADHGMLDAVFRGWAGAYRERSPLQLESSRIEVRHLIPGPKGEFIGRLYITIDPAFRRSDDRPIFFMQLTARGKPLTPDYDGTLGFLDLGRRYIVESFDAATTPLMHKLWRKRNGS